MAGGSADHRRLMSYVAARPVSSSIGVLTSLISRCQRGAVDLPHRAMMKAQSESIDEQCLEHQCHLIGAGSRVGGRFGGDVVERLVRPLGYAGQLIWLQAVGDGDQAAWPEVLRDDSYAT